MAPWPTGIAGSGDSLTRTQVNAYGNTPASWSAQAVSVGRVVPLNRFAGDANEDGLFDEVDLELTSSAGKYLTNELATWTEGDWNGDGFFDQSDIVRALQSGRYSNGPANAFSFKASLSRTREPERVVP